MDNRIGEIKSDFRKVSEEARQAFGNFSVEQLNWKPADSGWSVGQCFEHLIKTNEQFYPELAKVSGGKRQNSFWENWSPFTGMAGRFLKNAVSTDSKKAKAPSKKVVPLSNVEPDIIERFACHIDDLNQKVEACANADRLKTVLTSPFLAVFTYSLDDAYTVLVEHTRRHFRQAKRVTEAEGFPLRTTGLAGETQSSRPRNAASPPLEGGEL